MNTSIFNAKNVIHQHISNAELKVYFVGFEYNKYRYEPLVKSIMSAIVDFSFGFHEGILKSASYDQNREAAKKLYPIEIFDEANPDHTKLKKGVRLYNDAQDFFEKKYLNRGEFGELILHLLLREYFNTVPLVSKIKLKDAAGITAHGFDSVHISQTKDKNQKATLFLGESKLKNSGREGIDELINDIEKHFTRDFLTIKSGELIIIGGNRNNFLPIEKFISDHDTITQYQNFLADKEYWFNQLDGLKENKPLNELFDAVTIPLLCTFESNEIYTENTQDTDAAFKEGLDKQIKSLKALFTKKLNKLQAKYKESGEPISTNLNIVLMLFPIPNKYELIKRLHDKLYHRQNI